MTLQFITFKRVAPGGVFRARERNWVKIDRTVTNGQLRFNAYEVGATSIDLTEQVAVAEFDEALLVHHDPRGDFAPWARGCNDNVVVLFPGRA